MKPDILSAPCVQCGAATGAPCSVVEVVDDVFFEATRLDDLYYYAVSCALSALVRHAGLFGRGWYLFSDGEMIIAAQLLL